MHVYMCVHVCVYMCMFICMYMYGVICVSVYMYAYTGIYTCVWAYICTRVGAFCLFLLSNPSSTCVCLTGVFFTPAFGTNDAFVDGMLDTHQLLMGLREKFLKDRLVDVGF